MFAKIFGLLVLAAVVTSGNALKQITLEDETFAFLTNELIGKTLTIPKFTLDILQSCHVVLPSGELIEVFPNNQLNDPYIRFLNAAEPFQSCAIGFLGAPTSHTGTYELYSLVADRINNDMTLTNKRFHLTLKEIEP